MERRNGYRKQNSALWRSLRDGDFEEADVWAVFKERKDSTCSKADQSPFQVQRNLNMPSAARMIPRTSSDGGSSNSNNNNNSTNEVKQRQQSAPVKIPDWSKISHKKSKKKAHENNYYDDSDDDDDHHGVLDCGDKDSYDDDDDDEDDEYGCKVPPHEFIAERLAKSQISSFSVFEGVGRTLKGRDLSKVRNAVLTKTGFLE